MRFAAIRRFGLIAGLVFLLAGAAGSGSAASPATAAGPYAGQGMWIWYIDSSENGNLGAIIRRAKAAKVKTLYIKSGDGTNVWKQFTRPMVKRFQRAGLKVCGWQYVYGTSPVREAAVSAVARQRGANCFVIDAETEYEGKYSAADRYIRELRRRVGPKFRLALSTFPYNFYHPAFPYSVFLGPGAATANLPQVYWKTIGDPVAKAVGIAWRENTIYKRRIFPVGQTWENPSARELLGFRRYAKSYGVAPSWWSWQETSAASWRNLAKPIKPLPGFKPTRARPVITAGSRGDAVVWLQQHLVAAGFNVPIDGIYRTKTRMAVRKFQARKNLEADGVVGSQTWAGVLKVRPVRVKWSAPKPRRLRAGISAFAPSRPLSANLPTVRNEIAGAKDSR